MIIITVTITTLYVIMVNQHVNGKVVTVNNNGTKSSLCCKDGMCACSSLDNALFFMKNNTVISITSKSILLRGFVLIGWDQRQKQMGSKSLNNITITGNKGAIVMCNNTGAIFCGMCSDVFFEAIIWDQCGNVQYTTAGGVIFSNTANISIINCTFQNFILPCSTVKIAHPTGAIYVINSKFMFNKVLNVSSCTYFDRSHFYKNIWIYQPKSAVKIVINNSLFYRNGNLKQNDSIQYYSFVYSGASFAYYSLVEIIAKSSILIKNTHFISNNIRGVYVVDEASKTEIILDSVNVSNNSQGIYVLAGNYNENRDISLKIYSSFFTLNNNGTVIVNLVTTNHIEIYNTTFADNKGNGDMHGTAIYAIVAIPSTINVSFCSFFNNTGGLSIVYFSVLQEYLIYSQTFINLFITSSNFTSNKIGSALYITRCFLVFYFSTLFRDNSARSGAGVYATENSQITVDDGSNVWFIDNTASLRGGAMYIDLANCYDRGIVFTNITRYDAISFINNSAKLSGNSMYFNIPNSCDVVRNYARDDSAAYFPYKFNYTQSRSIIGPPISASPYEINLCSPAKCGLKNGTDCVIKNHKMLGQSIYFNATVCGYFSAGAETTQFQVNCINCEFKYKLLEKKIIVQNGSINRISLLSVGADRDLENDSNIILNVSSLLSSEYRQLTATLSLTLSSCYNGFLFSRQSQRCECYNKDGYIQCEGDTASIKLGYWFGVFSGSHTYSVCHNDYCNFFAHRKETRNGFYNLPDEIDDQCNSHRTGITCGQCSKGYTLAYNSPDCISVEKCSPGMTVLVLILTALYWVAIVSMLFGITYYLKTKAKVSLGYLYGIMYFYSTVDILLTSNLYITDKVFYTVTTLSSFTKLNPQFLGRLCLTNSLDAIDQQFIHYCHMMFILMILIGITITAKFCKTIAFYTDRCIVQVACLFLLLSYSSLTSISLVLLRPLKFDKIDTLYTYLSPHIKYFSKRHTAYASVAISCGIIVTIGLPFLLLVEPLVLKVINKLLNKRTARHIERFMEKRNCLVSIKLLLIKLQDCYKDQYRCFAAYYLICRLVIMLITYFANDDYNNMIYYLQTACVVIAMTHIWIQPYKNDMLNVIDTTILLIMLLIVNLSAFSFSNMKVEAIVISFVIAPMFFLVIMKTITFLRYPLCSMFVPKVIGLSRSLFQKLQNCKRNVSW